MENDVRYLFLLEGCKALSIWPTYPQKASISHQTSNMIIFCIINMTRKSLTPKQLHLLQTHLLLCLSSPRCCSKAHRKRPKYQAQMRKKVPEHRSCHPNGSQSSIYFSGVVFEQSFFLPTFRQSETLGVEAPQLCRKNHWGWTLHMQTKRAENGQLLRFSPPCFRCWYWR